jgi:hypothetical protein
MSDFGLDEELQMEEVKPELEKPKKKLFATWTVDGMEYNLKLNTAMICKLEEKFRTNLLNIISIDGIPQLGVMLTIVQGAITPWHHGITYTKVQQMYDKWLEEGGSQVKLLADVILPTMTVSGFFTPTQAEELSEKMKQTEDLM